MHTIRCSQYSWVCVDQRTSAPAFDRCGDDQRVGQCSAGGVLAAVDRLPGHRIVRSSRVRPCLARRFGPGVGRGDSGRGGSNLPSLRCRLAGSDEVHSQQPNIGTRSRASRVRRAVPLRAVLVHVNEKPPPSCNVACLPPRSPGGLTLRPLRHMQLARLCGYFGGFVTATQQTVLLHSVSNTRTRTYLSRTRDRLSIGRHHSPLPESTDDA